MEPEEILSQLLRKHFFVYSQDGHMYWSYGDDHMGDIDPELERACLEFRKRVADDKTGEQ